MPAVPFYLFARRVALACIAWAVAVLALWLGAIAVCPDGACGVTDYDRWLLGALQAARQPWLDVFFANATWLGSIAVLLPAALVMSWLFLRRGKRAPAALLLFALGGAWLLSHVSKMLVARPRPDLYSALIEMPVDPSFPSAHSMQITAFALAFVLAPGYRPGWTIIAAAAAIIAVVALSRPYLQVHFPSDVLFGLIAGAGWVIGLQFLSGARR
jgi:membrane-associated phospholipid phosphatase